MWRKLLSLMVGLLVLGAMGEIASAKELQGMQQLSISLSKIVQQEFGIKMENGTIISLNERPTSVTITENGTTIKQVEKYHFKNINLSKITFITQHNVRTVLVIGSSKKQKVNILWKIKPNHDIAKSITIIDTDKRSTIPTGNTEITFMTKPKEMLIRTGNGNILIVYDHIASKFHRGTISNKETALIFGPFELNSDTVLNVGEFALSSATVNSYYYVPSPSQYPIEDYFDIYDYDGDVVGRAVVAIYGTRKSGSYYAHLYDGQEGYTSVGYAVSPADTNKYSKLVFHSLSTTFKFYGGYFSSDYPPLEIKLSYDAFNGDYTSSQFREVFTTLVNLASIYLEGGGFLPILLDGLTAESRNNVGTDELTKYYRGPEHIAYQGVIMGYIGTDEIGQYYTYTVHLPFDLEEDIIKFYLTVRPGIAANHPDGYPTDVLFAREYSIPIFITLEQYP